VIFGPAGVAYVYLIYGIYHLFNVVTNRRDVPHAVLVRALEPVEGIPVMLERNRQEETGPYAHPGTGESVKGVGVACAGYGDFVVGGYPFYRG